MASPCIAIVAYNGVAADESQAFADVFRAVPGARVVTVGSRLGVVAGAGGTQVVATRYEDVTPDVVVVPGGLGSHRHADVADWIDRVGPRFVLASSTGSALLAAGGLLTGRRVATHWLAGPLVESFGARVVDDRVAVDDPFVTCRGALSAVDAALLVVRAMGGERLVAVVREAMVARPLAAAGCDRSRRRWRPRGAHRVTPDPWAPVEVVLDEHDLDR